MTDIDPDQLHDVSSKIVEADNDAVLQRIVSLSDGYETWGDEEDTSTTIARIEDGAAIVRVQHGTRWPVLGIERLEPALCVEEGCALAARELWRSSFISDDSDILLDLASGRAFRLSATDISTFASTTHRTQKLTTALTKALGKPVALQLSPLRTVGGWERYALGVTVAAPEDEDLRHALAIAIEIALEEVIDREPDFEQVEIEAEAMEMTFVPA